MSISRVGAFSGFLGNPKKGCQLNREQKSVVEKLRHFWNSVDKVQPKFSVQERSEIDKMIAMDLLNETAFIKMGTTELRQYQLRPAIYPFTARGERELNRGWYFRLRESQPVAIVRDVFAVLGFLAALYITFLKIIGN